MNERNNMMKTNFIQTGCERNVSKQVKKKPRNKSKEIMEEQQETHKNIKSAKNLK